MIDTNLVTLLLYNYKNVRVEIGKIGGDDIILLKLAQNWSRLKSRFHNYCEGKAIARMY